MRLFLSSLLLSLVVLLGPDIMQHTCPAIHRRHGGMLKRVLVPYFSLHAIHTELDKRNAEKFRIAPPTSEDSEHRKFLLNYNVSKLATAH